MHALLYANKTKEMIRRLHAKFYQFKFVQVTSGGLWPVDLSNH